MQRARWPMVLLVIPILLAGLGPPGLADDDHDRDRPVDPTPAEESTAAERRAALDRANELSRRAAALYAEGKLSDAEALVREEVSLREKALGPDHPELATNLFDLARLYQRTAQLEQALSTYERVLEIREKTLGPDHVEVAEALYGLSQVKSSLKRYEEARSLLERSLRINEKALGPDHPFVGMTLDQLASLLETLKKYEEARPLRERAVSILEKALGGEHPDVGAVVLNLANLLQKLRRHAEARPLYERALRINEEAHGPSHPRVGRLLGALARTLEALGDTDRAHRLLERAVSIFEEANGDGRRELGTALYTLANLLSRTGHHERAKPLYERALEVYERTLGPEHRYVGLVLHGLGFLLQEMGHTESARPLYERALRIEEAHLGAKHPEFAVSLNNLAGLLWEMGQPDQALPLFERAISIFEEAFGPEDWRVAGSLHNLGLLLWSMGRPEKARPLYERALRTEEKVHGPDHPAVATTLNNLGRLLAEAGEHDEAMRLFERALAIRESALGPEHRDVARVLANMALLRQTTGQAEPALRLWERTLDIREKVLDPEHPDVAMSLRQLARLHQDKGEYERAGVLLERSLSLLERRARKRFVGLQASERFGTLHSLRRHLDAWLQLAPRLGRSGYPEVLRVKGVAARATAAERRLTRRGGQRAARRIEELRAAERRLSKLANSVPPASLKREHSAWTEAYAGAAAEREELALALARDFATVREGLERLDLTLQDLVAHLPPKSVLVDFLRSGGRYLAWVVRAKGAPVRLDLGAASTIDAAAEAFAGAVAASGRSPLRGPLRVGRPEAREVEAGAVRTLRKLVFDPLEAEWDEDIETVYLCPDAALAALPFAALPGAEERNFLIDDYVLVYVAMAQDLVPWPDPTRPGTGAIAIGDVDYRRASEGKVHTAECAPRGIAVTDRAPRGPGFTPLPGTRTEVEFIQEELGEACEVVLGAEATEARLRAQSKGKHVLHLATHGFVREDLMKGLRRREDGDRWLGVAQERQLAVGHDPMNLAGLAFAGASLRDGGHGDDGILTAAEASYLDLGGVDLVVLSACETALGKAESGEGVLGLVQGFQMAGAKRVLASLWQVDDEATMLLMRHLYDAMLREEDPSSPAEALREAARKVRSSTGEGGRSFAAPRYWAAWVLWGLP